MKKIFLPSILLFSLMILSTSHEAKARDRERQFNRGRGGLIGNERSDRINGRVGVGRPEAGGNGCPQGTMSVVFSPDNLSFSILFDKFVAEVPSGTKGQTSVMSCDTVIPFEIPENSQMEITRVDYRGFVGVPKGGRAMLQSVLNFFDRDRNFRNRRGGERDKITLRYVFSGPLAENYEISTGVISDGQAPETETSPCGGTAYLRVRNQIQVSAGISGESASATVDSIDGSSNAVYYVNWKACRDSTGNPDIGPGGPNRPGRPDPRPLPPPRRGGGWGNGGLLGS